jgi:excisionase family DNA binding protein
VTDTLDFRTPEWLAETLDIDKNAVYRYLNEGTLPGLQLGRKWLISESTVVRFLKEEEARQTADRRRHQGGKRDKFTDDSHRIFVLAEESARGRNHNWIGTEHLLFAVLKQAAPAAIAMIEACGTTPTAVHEALEAVLATFVIGESAGATHAGIGFTPRAKRAIEVSLKEAEALDAAGAGPEHMLVALVSIDEGIAAEVMRSLGATAEKLRAALMEAETATAPGP